MKIVTAAIIRSGEKLLIARRKKGQKLEGYWEFPGGKIEDGETLQQCLSRELDEEFGVTAEVGSVLTESEYHYGHGAIKLVALEVIALEGDLSPTVHDQVEWVTADTILDYNLAPADIPIAKEFVANVW